MTLKITWLTGTEWNFLWSKTHAPNDRSGRLVSRSVQWAVLQDVHLRRYEDRDNTFDTKNGCAVHACVVLCVYYLDDVCNMHTHTHTHTHTCDRVSISLFQYAREAVLDRAEDDLLLGRLDPALAPVVVLWNTLCITVLNRIV